MISWKPAELSQQTHDVIVEVVMMSFVSCNDKLTLARIIFRSTCVVGI